MKLPIIRTLAQNHTLETLENAEKLFESNQENVLNVEGSDVGEIFTHILMAKEIRIKMEKEGLSLSDAVREHSKRIQKIINTK
jgi:hypothetical protein